mgnify:CR=1 FL=1
MRQRNAKAGPPPPLQIGKPFPDDRAILWAPVEGLTRAMELSQPAILITQGALREVIRHLSSSPDQELLGFLIGEPCECPKTQRRYLCITGTLRTGHAIAEDEPIQIPDAEWLGQQLEVRRRRSTLIGWYHSTPYLSPSPAALDLESHRARFTEPWQCGLVIATEGNEPAGGFFRAHADAADGGAYVPFYEQVDEEGALEGGRFRTLIDWKSYSTSELVEHDENERSVHTSGMVRRADTEEGVKALPLMIPQPSLDGEPHTAMRSRWVGIGIMTAVALAITWVAVQIWDSHQLPEPPMAALPQTHEPTGARKAAALAAQQRADSIAAASAVRAQAPPSSSRDSAALAQATPPAAPIPAPVAPPVAPLASPVAPGAVPTAVPDARMGTFDSLADSLAQTLVNYRTRRADFEAKRLSCTELSHGYRAADEAQVSLAKIAGDARALDPDRRARYLQLTAGMDTVNNDFDSSKCKRL